MRPKSALPEHQPLPVAPEVPEAVLEDESPLVTDERAYEALEAKEQEDRFLEDAEDAPTSTVTPAPTTDDAQTDSAPAVTKDEVTIQLEKILEDGLGEYLASMPEEARLRFLYKGQETAGRLSIMIHGFKIQAKKVVELIREWLLTIPGVNKFFLEQEAKIKTDLVLELGRAYHEKSKNLP